MGTGTLAAALTVVTSAGAALWSSLRDVLVLAQTTANACSQLAALGNLTAVSECPKCAPPGVSWQACAGGCLGCLLAGSLLGWWLRGPRPTPAPRSDEGLVLAAWRPPVARRQPNQAAVLAALAAAEYRR